MARYKVLKGVAHDIGHSFTSLMNYVADDYVMGHILRFARRSGHDTLTIDFVTGKAEPAELVLKPISDVPGRYTKWFWEMIKKQGSDPSFVHSAKLTLKFDIATERPAAIQPRRLESPYQCHVLIKDSRGKDYEARFEGWWFAEPIGTAHDIRNRLGRFRKRWRRWKSSIIGS